MRRTVTVAICVLLLIPQPLLACLWDSETLTEERARFPSTLELLTGKFLRHSPAFYRWRMEDRTEKLKSDPENDRWLDDLAVSHEKLGQHDEAIAIARKQLARNPDRYETLANLGTFLIHARQYDEGLSFIDRALEVNPDAHFGREKYQRILVRYVQSRMQDDKLVLPLATAKPRDEGGFLTFLGEELEQPDAFQDPEQLAAAIKGVQGMMRFSQHDHPILLEVLGELLLGNRHDKNDAKRLATRCYLLASRNVDDVEAKEGYRVLARSAIDLQTRSSSNFVQLTLEELEVSLDAELKESEQWFNELQQQEQAWIDSGLDVEQAYNDFYRGEPTIEAAQTSIVTHVAHSTATPMVLIFAALASIIVAVFAVVIRLLRSRETT